MKRFITILFSCTKALININQKYRKIILYCIIAMFSMFLSNNYAQSVKRQCVSSYAATLSSHCATIGQTIGQPYVTTTAHKNKVSILQGFQQPVVFKVE